MNRSLMKSLFLVPAVLIGMNIHSQQTHAEEQEEKELKVVAVNNELKTLNEYESKLQRANSLVNTVPVNNQKQNEEIDQAQKKLETLKESTIKLNAVVDKLDSIQSKSNEVKEKIEELKSTAKELESKKETLINQIDEMKQKKEQLAAEKAEKERIAAEESQRKLEEQAKKEQEEQAAQANSSPTKVSTPVSVGGLEFGPDGLLVESATSNAQQVINLLLSIPGHANGAWYHAQTGLDSLIDQLSTPEAVHVIHRIEGAGFGQTGDGWAGIDSAQSHQNFVNRQVNGRFGGSVHSLLKAWGTYSYGGY